MLTSGHAKAVLGVLAGVVLTLGAAGCGSGGGGGGTAAGSGGSAAAKAGASGGSGGAAGPTALPSGLTTGCAGEPQADTCTYGGDAAAPAGVYVGKVGEQIQADKFKLTDPMTLQKDASAPGGNYLHAGAKDSGEAVVAIQIPATGYYQLWDASRGLQQTGTPDENSMYFVWGATPPNTDKDATYDLNVDGNWHKHDTQGGCVVIRHDDPADQPSVCLAWHLKKGIALVHFMGREYDQDNAGSAIAWVKLEPAAAAK